MACVNNFTENQQGEGSEMAKPGAFFDAIQALGNQEEEPHTNPEKAVQENVSKSREEVPGEVTLGEAGGSEMAKPWAAHDAIQTPDPGPPGVGASNSQSR